MIRRCWPYLAVAVGSALSAASCFTIAALGGFVGLAATPFTLAGWLLGSLAVVGGLVFLCWLALRPAPPRSHRDHPARKVHDGTPARRRTAGRVSFSARRARTRGGSSAAPLRGNGGGAADAPTEELPAVDEDGDSLVLVLAQASGALRGRVGRWPVAAPLNPRGRDLAAYVMSAHRSRGGGVRTVAGGLGDPPATPAPVHAYSVACGCGRWPAAGLESMPATTIQLPPVADSHLAEVPMRVSSRAAHGTAALALSPRTGARAAQIPPTWTAGGAYDTAGLDEINH